MKGILRPCRTILAAAALASCAALLCPAPGTAQNTGSILGRVRDSETGAALAGATLRIEGARFQTISGADGRFILVAVPPGTHRFVVELLGYRPATYEEVVVSAGNATPLVVDLVPEAIDLPGVTAEVERIRLVEPEINATHEVVLARELRELPVDRIEEAIELAPGVSEGHFRGGRVGQEVYVVDGLEFKNQFEASTQGPALELPPTALEEIEVVTGGLGSEFGSALSGVVRYSTRRGREAGWESRAAFRTDHWVPEGAFRGFSELSASAGGPLSFLGAGTTFYGDVLLQGMLDSEPRARGLTCLEPGDGSGGAASLIASVSGDPATRHLACPYSSGSFPHQRGDRLLAFFRGDRPLGPGASLTATLLRNRLENQLYTSAFKYNPEHQLGQRTTGTLATLALDWRRQGAGRGSHVTVRGSAFRLDRYLGVIDPEDFEDRTTLGGFGLQGFRFLGEDFARSPIEDQIASGDPVPGYLAPGGSVGSPYGPAAEGIFFTEGTPEIANWTRTEFLGGDVVGEVLSAQGHVLRAGASGKLYRIETYERVLSYLPGSSPSYARFFPGTGSGFVDVSLAAADQVTVHLGARIDAFRAGLTFRRDRGDFQAPTVDTEWKTAVTPRIGISGPVPGTDGATAFRFNFGQVTQPPDFRFFLDTTIGDSLRTDVRRQGNPDLAFERGTTWEVGLTQRLDESASLSLVGFRKELTNLVTGSLDFAGVERGQFTTGDFGTVQGAELSFRARWPSFRVRAGYALQKATGVASTALDEADSVAVAEREEFPLAFDRRHSIVLALFGGRAAGDRERSWGGSLLGSIDSGYPVDRSLLRAGADPGAPGFPERLPWTVELDLRVSREMGAPPGCGRCTWRIVADGRNLLDRANVVALRRTSGELAPTVEEIQAMANRGIDVPIPRESPRYAPAADLDGNGLITDDEYRKARLAAAVDRFDPSLFFGEALQLRLGVEVTF